MIRERSYTRQLWAPAMYIGRSRGPFIWHDAIRSKKSAAALAAGGMVNEDDPVAGWKELEGRGARIIRVTLSGEMPEA